MKITFQCGPARDTAWTPEAIATLRTLWAEGKPAREIGEIIGFTRFAVIGKAHRLGLGPHKFQVGVHWTPEKDATLEQLWADSQSVRKISDVLAIGRKSVATEALRLNLTRQEPVPREPNFRRSHKRKPKPAEPIASIEAVFTAPKPEPLPAPAVQPAKEVAPMPAISLVCIEGAGAAVLALTRTTCRWPIGDPLRPDFRYCMEAKPDDENVRYCQVHQLAHRAAPPSGHGITRVMRPIVKIGRVFV